MENSNWDGRLKNLVVTGIVPLYSAATTNDLEERKNIVVKNMSWASGETFEALAPTLLTTLMPSSGAPPGWLWAYESDIEDGMSPYASSDETWCVQEFGYVFWDEDRLQKWGTVLGGRFAKAQGGNNLYDRRTLEAVERRPSAAWNRQVLFGY